MRSGKPDIMGLRSNTNLRIPELGKLVGLLVLTGALSIAPARGDQAVSGLSNPLGGYVSGVGGWSFRVQQNVLVTGLGCFDFDLVDTGPAKIGLWASDGTLLASNMVSVASPLFNLTRSEPITPVQLFAGQSYSIGAYSPSGALIVDGIDPGEGGSVALAPEFQLGTAVTGPGGFEFPGTVGGGEGSAILGPNFEFVVPEPSALVLLGLGVLGLARAWRSR